MVGKTDLDEYLSNRDNPDKKQLIIKKTFRFDWDIWLEKMYKKMKKKKKGGD